LSDCIVVTNPMAADKNVRAPCGTIHDRLVLESLNHMHPSAHKLRQAIAANRTVIGTFLVEFTGPAVLHCLADAGFDFAVLDCEHGNHDSREVESILETAYQAEFCLLVRPPNTDRGLITRVLDAGAAGVLIPAIDSLDAVHQAVKATKYSPVGKRGVHLFRGHTRHRRVEAARFLAEANRELLTLIQIELKSAVDVVDRIAAIEGVDGLYVGPGDLSVDLGVPGQWNAPPVQEAIAATARACRENKKIAGCHFNDVNELASLKQSGVQMLGYRCDAAMFKTAAEQLIESVRDRLPSKTGERIESSILAKA